LTASVLRTNATLHRGADFSSLGLKFSNLHPLHITVPPVIALFVLLCFLVFFRVAMLPGQSFLLSRIKHQPTHVESTVDYFARPEFYRLTSALCLRISIQADHGEIPQIPRRERYSWATNVHRTGSVPTAVQGLSSFFVLEPRFDGGRGPHKTPLTRFGWPTGFGKIYVNKPIVH
jgi:hypothetical protein